MADPNILKMRLLKLVSYTLETVFEIHPEPLIGKPGYNNIVRDKLTQALNAVECFCKQLSEVLRHRLYMFKHITSLLNLLNEKDKGGLDTLGNLMYVKVNVINETIKKIVEKLEETFQNVDQIQLVLKSAEKALTRAKKYLKTINYNPKTGQCLLTDIIEYINDSKLEEAEKAIDEAEIKITEALKK
ncbi:MAG: hypothetical protein ACTSSJ_05940 [Candidatus Odinarchaeia archaeon]